MANGFNTDETSYVGDDPTGIGYDEAGTSFASGVGYGSQNIDTGGNETSGQVLSQAGFNQAMNITTKNPYGDQGFFTRVFGIPADILDYTNLGIDTGGIANLAYDRYKNPFGKVQSGVKFEDLKLREGMSEGEKTRFGEIAQIDRPQGVGETIARTGFGLTPLGPIAALMGKDQLALRPDEKLNFKGSPNYDPTLDRNNSLYQGPQGFLGQIGKGIESITFGGARPISKTSKGILDLIEGQNDKDITTSGIGTVNKEVTDNAVNNVVSDNMIQGPPNLIDKNVINLGLVGTPGFNVSGKFDYPGTDRDSTSSYTKAGPDFVTEKFPTEDEVYQEFLKRMYAN